MMAPQLMKFRLYINQDGTKNVHLAVLQEDGRIDRFSDSVIGPERVQDVLTDQLRQAEKVLTSRKLARESKNAELSES